MESAELRDRLRQEVAKRGDSLRARLGYDFSEDYGTASAGLNSPRFFFAPGSVDPILTLLCQRIPSYQAEVLQLADRICRHEFDLLGYTGLDYGREIDWHLDAVHGKRASQKAFHRVRYLDFQEVGDSKVTWELNRHQHWLTLAKAYRLSGERRYLDEISWQWRHWRANNPYPVGTNWASSLEVAFRCLAWIWTGRLLEGSPGLTEVRGEWEHALALHGRHIERYLSTYFSPNTHLLGEGVALFFLGVMLPQLAPAERWKKLGLQIVLDAARKQVRADGFHYEQSTYYHVYALDFFLHVSVLADINEIVLPAEFEQTIEKMLTALFLLSRPGPPPRFGDDDGGRLFDPRRNRDSHMLDPLVTGAILFRRGDYKAAVRGLTEEAIWLLGLEGVRQWDLLEEEEAPPRSAALPEAGFYLLPAEKTQLVVNVGPSGGNDGGHVHADALSVTLQHRGTALLIDAGTYEYIGPGSDRQLFRGTSMHNTVSVDGVSQAVATGPFSWQRPPLPRVEQWLQGAGFDLLRASHDGYESLPSPVRHERCVLSLRDGRFLVRDVIRGTGKHRLDIAWHLGPELRLQEENIFRTDAGIGLAICPAEHPKWGQDVRRELWSPAYGAKASANVLHFSAELTLPAEFAVLLVTWQGEPHGEISLKRMDEVEDANLSAYRSESKNSESIIVFSPHAKPWQLGPIASDAAFVFWERSRVGSDRHVVFCDGSYARHETAELRTSNRAAWAEEIVTNDAVLRHSSDETALEPSNHEQPDIADSPSGLKGN